MVLFSPLAIKGVDGPFFKLKTETLIDHKTFGT